MDDVVGEEVEAACADPDAWHGFAFGTLDGCFFLVVWVAFEYFVCSFDGGVALFFWGGFGIYFVRVLG